MNRLTELNNLYFKANLIASVLTGYDNVVTVFADDFKKYLSTDLSKEIRDDEWMVSNKVELVGFEYI